MQSQADIIQFLRENRTDLETNHGVERIGLFGSFSSGAGNEDSDVDLIVEFSRPISLLFIEFAEYLEDLLGKKVVLLTPAGVDDIRVKRVAESIRESVQYV